MKRILLITFSLFNLACFTQTKSYDIDGGLVTGKASFAIQNGKRTGPFVFKGEASPGFGTQIIDVKGSYDNGLFNGEWEFSDTRVNRTDYNNIVYQTSQAKLYAKYRNGHATGHWQYSDVGSYYTVTYPKAYNAKLIKSAPKQMKPTKLSLEFDSDKLVGNFNIDMEGFRLSGFLTKDGILQGVWHEHDQNGDETIIFDNGVLIPSENDTLANISKAYVKTGKLPDWYDTKTVDFFPKDDIERYLDVCMSTIYNDFPGDLSVTYEHGGSRMSLKQYPSYIMVYKRDSMTYDVVCQNAGISTTSADSEKLQIAYNTYSKYMHKSDAAKMQQDILDLKQRRAAYYNEEAEYNDLVKKLAAKGYMVGGMSIDDMKALLNHK